VLTTKTNKYNSSATAERPRDARRDFKGVGQFEAVLSWRVTFRANIYGLLDSHNTTLPMDVFTQKNFVADIIRLMLNFIQKIQKSTFQPPFWDLGVTCALRL